MFWTVFDIFFLALVFYLPFGLALNIAPDIDLASVRVLILLCFTVLLVGMAFKKQRKFVFSLQSFGLLAILIFGALSLVSAPELGWGLRKFLVFLSISPLYFVAASFLYGGWPQSDRLLKVIFVSAATSAFLGLIQFLSQFVLGQEVLADFYLKKLGPVFWGQSFSTVVAENQSWLVNVSGSTIMRAFGFFPDPRMLAFFMGLASPIVLSVFLYEKKRALGALFCLIFIVLLLTFSRGGYLGIFFAILAVLVLLWRHLAQKQKRVILAAAVLGMFLIIVFAGPVVSRFVSSFLLDEGSSLNRIAIWQGSWQVFLQNPFLGVGLGNYPRAIEPLAIYRSPITSHNLYLDILSETGIFGLAAWLFLIFGSSWQILRGIKGDKGDLGNQRALRIGVFGSLVYFSVHSFFETAVFNPAILAMLMIILALVSVANKFNSPLPSLKIREGATV